MGKQLIFRSAFAGLLLFAATSVLIVPGARAADRSGREVVEAVCAACHAPGAASDPKIAEKAKSAPKIGDEKAWAPLAKKGLTSLTESALKGIRNMPAHGGNMTLSDIEIERAVTYMVNRSGGKWTEPISGVTPAVERRGKDIVESRCADCHQTGKGGAPKIGDQAAWLPRLKQGLNYLVRSAIHGHGAMPPRGGFADLTDTEIRGAIIYMFNPGSAKVQPSPAVSGVTRPDPNHTILDGVEIYLGVVPADTLRSRAGTGKGGFSVPGTIPAGSDQYHVNVSLFDAKTRAPIADARVEVSIADPAMGRETKVLDPFTANNMRSYGNYFRMTGKNPYVVNVRVWKPGAKSPVEAKFDFKPQ